MVSMISGLKNVGTSAYTKVAENPKKAAMLVALAVIVAGAHRKGVLNTNNLRSGFHSATSKVSNMSSRAQAATASLVLAGVGKIAYNRFSGDAEKSTGAKRQGQGQGQLSGGQPGGGEEAPKLGGEQNAEARDGEGGK